MTEDDLDLPVLKFKNEDSFLVNALLPCLKAISHRSTLPEEQKIELSYFAGLIRRLPRIHDNFPATLSLTKNCEESWASRSIEFSEGGFRLTTSEGYRGPAGHEYESIDALFVSESSRTEQCYDTLEGDWIAPFQRFAEDETVEVSLEWEHDQEDCYFSIGDRDQHDWEELLTPATGSNEEVELNLEEEEEKEDPPELFAVLIEEMPEIERLPYLVRKLCTLPTADPETIAALSKTIFALERLPLPTGGIDAYLELRESTGERESNTQSLRITEEALELHSSSYVVTNPAFGGDSQVTVDFSVETSGHRDVPHREALSAWIDRFEERIRLENQFSLNDSSDDDFDWLQDDPGDSWKFLQSNLL